MGLQRKSQQFTELTQSHIDILKNILPTSTYNTATDIIYEGQIPHIGLILLKGDCSLKKRNKIIEELSKFSVAGVNELIHHLKSYYTVCIASGSEVLILDKSSVLEVKDIFPDLFKILIHS